MSGQADCCWPSLERNTVKSLSSSTQNKRLRAIVWRIFKEGGVKYVCII